jgi:hypothetical protein
MSERSQAGSGPPAKAHPENGHASEIAALRSRRVEVLGAIEASIPTEGSPSVLGDDAEYRAGRAAAVAATVEYSLSAIEGGGAWGPIPSALAAHARRAARAGVKPGVLVRRYLAAHRRFMGLMGDEIARRLEGDREAALERLRVSYRPLLDHIIDSLEEEYELERERLDRSPEQRRAKLVQRLLHEDLEPAELRELEYETASAWHLGIIATGGEGVETLRRLKAGGRHRLLVVQAADGTTWAWLAGRVALSFADFKRLLAANGRPGTSLAIGEPGSGLEGWRQTHCEAQMALLVARREPLAFTRCADVLPVAGALRDETIVEMYERAYVLPLNNLHKGGQPARRALRAYFEHGRNASSAGDAINVTRRTVENHLKEVRRALGDPLNLTGLEIALRLEELGFMAERSGSSARYSQ